MQMLYRLPDYFKTIIGHLVDTETEVDFLDLVFKKHGVKKVLDVACGVGRHAIPLSKIGYDVLGIDYSPYQIKRAREDGKRELPGAKFLLQNANKFSFRRKFDAAICMWTTLGEEPMRYEKVTKNVWRCLKKGGIFVIDNRSWENIPKSRRQVIDNQAMTPTGTKIKTRIFDRYTDNFRVREVQHVINGRVYDDLCITHLLKEKDWICELHRAGFSKITSIHDYKPGSRAKKPVRVTLVAVK
jgi:SAM-dependent methyltransferase